jgi:hypothetical protein
MAGAGRPAALLALAAGFAMVIVMCGVGDRPAASALAGVFRVADNDFGSASLTPFSSTHAMRVAQVSREADEGWREHDERELSRFSRRAEGRAEHWFDSESSTRWGADERRRRDAESGGAAPAEPRVVQQIEADVADESRPPPESAATYYRKLSEAGESESAGEEKDRGEVLGPREPRVVGEIESDGEKTDVRGPPNGGQAVTNDGRWAE